MSLAPGIFSREALLAFLAAILVSMALFPQAWFQGRSLYSTDLVLAREPWRTEWTAPDPSSHGDLRYNPQLGDLNDYFFPQLAFAVRTRHEQGHWPLWNPEIYGGVSLIGNPQIPLWNPFIRVLPLFQETDRPFSAWRLSLGLTWTGMLRFVLCLGFAYLWLRRVGAGPWSAACVALFVGAGPYAALWRFSTPEQVFSLMPMVLYFLEGLRRRWHAPSLVGAGLAFGLSCLGGYPQTSLVLGLFLVPWFWVRCRAHGAQAGLGRLSVVLGLGVAMALPCWLPFVSYLGEAAVGEVRAASAAVAEHASWLPDPKALLVPNWVRIGIESHQVALGIPLLLLLVLGLWRGSRLLLGVIAVLLLLHLDFLPLSWLQRQLLPLLEPSRVAAVLPLLIAYAWFRADATLAGRIPTVMRASWSLIAVVVLLWPGLGFHSALTEAEVYPRTATTDFLQEQHRKDPDLRIFQVDRGILDRNAPLVFDLPLTLGTDGMDPERYVLMVVHLLPEDRYGTPRTEWSTSLLRLDRPLFDQLATRLVLARKDQALPAHFRRLRTSGDLVVAEDPRAAPRAQLYSRALAFEEDRYRLIDMPTDEAVILEGGVPPLPGPAMKQGHVEIRERSSDRLVIGSDADGASYLLLRDNLLGGWSATVDGEPAGILRANFAFRALVLPAGRHEVTFEFAPASYSWGVLLALLSLVTMATMLAWGRISSRSGSPGPEAGPSRS